MTWRSLIGRTRWAIAVVALLALGGALAAGESLPPPPDAPVTAGSQGSAPSTDASPPSGPDSAAPLPPPPAKAPPVRRYTPPARKYTPPVRKYTPPVRKYTPPAQTRHYTPPVRKYTPPVQTYHPPATPRTVTPAPRHTPPAQTPRHVAPKVKTPVVPATPKVTQPTVPKIPVPQAPAHPAASDTPQNKIPASIPLPGKHTGSHLGGFVLVTLFVLAGIACALAALPLLLGRTRTATVGIAPSLVRYRAELASLGVASLLIGLLILGVSG